MSRQTDVVIIGGGPTGLLLAGELAGAGVRTAVLERAPQPASTPKANGVVGRAAVELRRRKLLRATGLHVLRSPRYGFGPFELRLGLLRSPLHILPIPQRRLEQLLAQRAMRLGAEILRGHEALTLRQDDTGVTVRVRNGEGEADWGSRYLVGCDGAHSLVRKRLGIAFPGTTSSEISRLARVTIPANAISRRGALLEVRGIGPLLAFRQNRTEHGSVAIAPANALDRSAPDDLYIVAANEPRGTAEPADELDEAELRASFRRVLGAELPFTAAFAARSTVANSRLAERYRLGRVFLAGDAAHVFSAGGSALNTGLLDAIVLAEKLAAVLDGDMPEGKARDALLDAYQGERQPAAQRVLAHTRVQVALEARDENGAALRELFGELLADRGAGRRIAALIEG